MKKMLIENIKLMLEVVVVKTSTKLALPYLFTFIYQIFFFFSQKNKDTKREKMLKIIYVS
jgi:hypothetical protein